MVFARYAIVIACAFGVARAIQQRSEVVTRPADDPPSLSDVEDQLGTVNDTIDEVESVIGTINSTAYDLIDEFLSKTTDFTNILGALQKAADMSAMLPGGDKIKDTATKFIDLANSTLEKAQGQLQPVLSKVQSQLETILPGIQDLIDSVTSEYLDAAKDVLALSNSTDSSLLKKHAKKEHASKATKKPKDHQKGKHGKNRVAMLQERASAVSGDMASAAVGVDQSVARKGSSNPCTKALADISKANTTLTALAAAVQAVNGTSMDTLGAILEVAFAGIDTLNASIAPALDAASAIPSSILSPVTKGLDAILSVGDSMQGDVDEQLATVQDMIEEATDNLATVYSLSDTLVAAVYDAQCQGACGEKMKSQCDS